MPCCSNIICNGCDYANLIRELKGSLELKCAFCRHPRISDEELELNLMKRVEANDSAAMCQIGGYRRNEGDYVTAFQHYSKAAELGDAHAHYLLTQMYYNGEGVKKDEKKEVYHLERAAIGGNPDARYDLGIAEWHKCRHARAVKHFIIAAKLGHDDSLRALKDFYRKGLVSKEDFAAALRGHQAADDATKSPRGRRQYWNCQNWTLQWVLAFASRNANVVIDTQNSDYTYPAVVMCRQYERSVARRCLIKIIDL
mmetsp:Transcript_27256/g.40978  ORF Transcript_27256/g.40978 Transcript_27256/m.40978 type:complete len:255 (+) Transcript_27256:409-1173(+)